MKGIYEIKATAFETNGEKGVVVSATASNEQYGDITAGYESTSKGIYVYAGLVDLEDPGEGPIDEFASRDEALASEYGDVFKAVFAVADMVI